MSQALKDLQTSAGATFMTVGDRDVPAHFGNETAAIAAATSGVAVCDRSHWGRIEVSDGDRLRFLHNQSTNDFMNLKPGQGCDTVFVTATARTLDLVSAYVLENSVLLLTHPTMTQRLMEWMDRFIFFSDKVQLKAVTEATATFSLVGPDSDRLLRAWGGEALIGQPNGTHEVIPIDGVETRVAVGSGLAIAGYTLFVAADRADALWKTLTEAGAVPMGELAWDHLRIQQGRPVPDSELTEDYNPLEAGLWHTVSFSKGCYIGQETIARLDTYKGVKQQLWGLKLTGTAEPGTVITAEGEKVGLLTSVTATDEGTFGLAYIRTKAGGVGLDVQVGEASGTVVDLPFLTRQRVEQQA